MVRGMHGLGDNYDVIRRGGLYVQKEPGNLGALEFDKRQRDFEKRSRNHLKALLAYGLKHGLPNLSRDEIRRRLRAL